MQDFSGETAWWQSVSWVGSPWMSLVVAQLLLLLVLGLLWGFAHGCVCGLWFCCGETHWWPLCSLKALKISALGAKCAFEYQHFLPSQRKQNSAGSCSAVFFSYGSSGLMAKTWSGRCCTALKKSVCWFFPPAGRFPPFCHMFLDSCRTVAGFAPGQLKAMGGSVEPMLPSLPHKLKGYFPPAEPYKVFLHMHFSRF